MKFDNGTWRKVKVSDLGRIVTGKTPKTSNSVYYGGDIPFLTPSDDMSAKYVVETKRTLTTEGRQSVKNMCLPADSVCVSCIGSDLGKVVVTTEETITNQQINSIIVDKTNYDVDFVYYAMSILGKKINYISKTSTAVPIVNKTSFSSFTIDCPDLHEQKKISQILAVFDDKFNNNNAINKNLSVLIQTIYQKRFTSKCQGILSDICRYSKERISVDDLTLDAYFSTENMIPNKAGVTTATSLPSTAQTTKCHIGDVLISNIRPYFKKILYCHREGGCSSDVLCFSPSSKKLSAFLYGVLYSDSFFDFMVAGSKGTKMPRGDKQQIMTYPIYVPTNDELDEYNAIAMPIIDDIYRNTMENSNLSSLRDTLLPRLISGEVDVSSVKI